MRLIAVALLAGTSLALSACGGSTDESAEPTAAATDTAATEDTAADAAATPEPTESASPTPTPSASASAAPTPAASAAAAPAKVAAAAPVTAPAAFNQCKICHSVEKGNNGLGPSLAGVYGDKAAAVPGFDFSDAMKSSGLTWNAANLDKYLENPQGTVPGTKMSFAGVKDAAKRQQIIDYLKSI